MNFLVRRRQYRASHPLTQTGVGLGLKICTLCAALGVAALGLPKRGEARSCEMSRVLDFAQLYDDRNEIVTTDQSLIAGELDEPLLRLDNSGNLLPGLAQSWRIDVEKRDLYFKLRQNCGWSDGAPIVAADFVLGLRELYASGEPKIPGWAVIRGANKVVTGKMPLHHMDIEAIDRQTLRVGINGDADLALRILTYISYTALPSHLGNQAEKWAIVSPERITSGTYVVTSANRKKIVAVMNPHYCLDSQPQIQRLTVYNSSNGHNDIRRFVKGDIDTVRDVSSRQVSDVLQAFAEGEKPNLHTEDSHRQVYLVINSEANAFRDPALRAAILPAFNFNDLLASRGSVEPFFERAKFLFHVAPPYQNAPIAGRVVGYKQGLERLKALMEAKNYSADHPLDLTIKTWPIARFETMAHLIASMLRQAHFNIEYIPEANIGDSLNSLNDSSYDLFVGSWLLDYLDPQNSWDGIKQYMIPALQSTARLSEFGLPDDFRTKSTEFEKRLFQSTNQEMRHAVLRELEAYISNAHVVLPLYAERTGVLTAHGLSFTPGFSQYARQSNWDHCEPIEQN